MPPRQQQQPPAYLDEQHQRISEFADWMWDGDDEAEAREAFVSDAMTKKGYQSRTRTEWEPPATDPKKDPGQRRNGSYFR